MAVSSDVPWELTTKAATTALPCVNLSPASGASICIAPMEPLTRQWCLDLYRTDGSPFATQR
jgi:hypothetical protein